MARGTSLVKLLDMLRIEARLSLNPAHNNQARDHQVMFLQREQERLWGDHDWPHLVVYRDIPLSAGQRYYQPPSDVSIERIQSLKVKTDNLWCTLSPGIGDGHYAAHDSDLGDQAWPPQAWAVREDAKIEIWPISDQNQDPTTGEATLRITGVRNLHPLVADGDRADLDDRLLALYAAAGILAANGAKDAQFKLEMASKQLNALLGNLQKRTKIRMFGVGAEAPRRPMITRYRAPGA